MIKINVNAIVEVELTVAGKKRWHKYYDDLPLPSEIRSKIKPKDIPTKFPLWELFRIFGDMMEMGSTEIPFKDNELTINEGIKYHTEIN